MSDQSQVSISMRTSGAVPGNNNCKAAFTARAVPTLVQKTDFDQRKARLASVIARDIVPRLQMMHQTLSSSDAQPPFDQTEIVEFGAVLMNADGAKSDAFFEAMRARGHSLETLFLGLFTETARHLGVLWEEDQCDFVDVTLGLARLQNLLCRFGGVDDREIVDRRQRALLTTLPGEKHVFGLDMVAVFLRNACWDVSLHKDLDAESLAQIVGAEWFGVVGLALSAESGLEKLARRIEAIREDSANPHVSVIVGGPLFVRKPDLVAQVGADATAPDASTATILAKKLILRQLDAVHGGANAHCL